jgi:hypothetical protein
MPSPQKLPLIRAILLATAMSTAVMTPPAFAETVEVTIMNTRGADGIYRPALRVLRGGTVTFFNSGDAGLTEDIIRDGGALGAWLGANVPAAANGEPVSFVVTKIESRPPVVKEEEEPGVEPEPKPTGKDCFALENESRATGDVSIRCVREELIVYCEATVPGWKRPNMVLRPFETPEEYCND